MYKNEGTHISLVYFKAKHIIQRMEMIWMYYIKQEKPIPECESLWYRHRKYEWLLTYST